MFPSGFLSITNNSLTASLSHFKCCPHNRLFHPLLSAAERRFLTGAISVDAGYLLKYSSLIDQG